MLLVLEAQKLGRLTYLDDHVANWQLPLNIGVLALANPDARFTIIVKQLPRDTY
jgi:hypothetical protein